MALFASQTKQSFVNVFIVSCPIYLTSLHGSSGVEETQTELRNMKHLVPGLFPDISVPGIMYWKWNCFSCFTNSLTVSTVY